jgi:hypothetical protein
VEGGDEPPSTSELNLMAVSTLVPTAGAATANTYCTRAVADQYHLDRPAVSTTWSGATNDQKDAALLWATKLLDQNFEWNGYVVDSVQKLLWPRSGLMDVNDYTTLSWTAIPERIQFATAEFARQLLAADRAGDSDVETQGVTSLKAGSVALTFKDNVRAKVVPDVVARMIPSAWGRVRGVSSFRQLERA